jgi:chromosome segregation ATPase
LVLIKQKVNALLQKNNLKPFFYSSLFVLLWFGLCCLLPGSALAQTPSVTEMGDMGEKLDQSKAAVEQFKNAWDRARLETTLYDQRAQRAYQRWLKAAKSLKAKAQGQRDKADLELQLSVERRKLAFSQWQSAQLREASEEAQVQAFAQDQNTKAIQDKIQQLQSKLSPLQTPAVSPKP